MFSQFLLEEWNNHNHHITQSFSRTVEMVESEKDYFHTKEKYFSLIPYNSSIKDYHLTFDNTATDIISQLFKKYVHNNTLIITSDSEHPNVQHIIKQYNNVLKIKLYKNNIDDVLGIDFQQYNNIFVYIIGTEISTGKFVQQYIFEQLKRYLPERTIFVLDACQELFFVERDYSLFDYVIGTSHSLLMQYNAGICISKTGDVGIINDKLCNEYYNYIKDITFGNLNRFRFVMNQVNYNLFSSSNVIPIYNGVGHIWTCKIINFRFSKYIKDKLYDCFFRIEDANKDITFVRVRSQMFLESPEKLLKGNKILQLVLTNV